MKGGGLGVTLDKVYDLWAVKETYRKDSESHRFCQYSPDGEDYYRFPTINFRLRPPNVSLFDLAASTQGGATLCLIMTAQSRNGPETFCQKER